MIKSTKEEYFQYAKFLKKLSEKREGEVRNEGVCSIFHRQFTTNLYRILPTEVVTSWEHFSGDYVFPVPSCNPEKSSSCEFAKITGYGHGMWSGEYGDYRRMYALHLANYFEDLANEK